MRWALSGLVVLVALSGHSHAENKPYRLLVHIDASAARTGGEDWAGDAVAQVGRIVEALDAVNDYDRQIFDGRAQGNAAKATRWQLAVLLGAKVKDENKRWYQWRFSRTEPINLDRLKADILGATTKAQRWHEEYGIPTFARSKMSAPPDMVVRLVGPPTRKDAKSGAKLLALNRSVRLLASSPLGHPTRLTAYASVSWEELPGRVAAPLIENLTKAVEAGLPKKWHRCSAPVPGACRVEVLALGQGAPADLLVPQGEAALPSSWRQSLNDLHLLSINQIADLRGLQAATGARAWCQWKAGPKSRLVIEQDGRPRSMTVHESVATTVRVLGAECMNADGINIEALQGNQSVVVCTLEEARGSAGCRWKPNSAASEALVRVGDAGQPLLERQLQIELPAQVSVSVDFFPAACPGAEKISPGSTSTFLGVKRLCVGYRIEVDDEGVPPEFAARLPGTLDFELRFGEKRVATIVGRSGGQLAGQVEFNVQPDWYGQPLTVGFSLQPVPILVDDTRYLSVPRGSSRSSAYVLTTYWSTMLVGTVAILGTFIAFVIGLRRLKARADAQAHRVQVRFTVPSWEGIQVAKVLRWTGQDEGQADLPDVLGLHKLMVERLEGGRYKLFFVRVTPAGAFKTRGEIECSTGISMPWGPFEVEVERWR